MRLTAHYFPRTKQVRSWWDSLDAQPTPLAYEVWVYILYDEGDHFFDSPAREAEVHAALTLALTLTLTLALTVTLTPTLTLTLTRCWPCRRTLRWRGRR